MDYTKLSEQILAAVGGKENVQSNMVCMTRLRIKTADPSKVDTEAIKAIDGVMGLVEDAEYLEVVLGPGVVNKVIVEFSKLTGVAAGDASEDDVVSAAKDNKAAQKAKYENKPVQRFLKKIANIFVPLLPGIISAGLINGIINVINFSTGRLLLTSGGSQLSGPWVGHFSLTCQFSLARTLPRSLVVLAFLVLWLVHFPLLTLVCLFLLPRLLMALLLVWFTFHSASQLLLSRRAHLSLLPLICSTQQQAA